MAQPSAATPAAPVVQPASPTALPLTARGPVTVALPALRTPRARITLGSGCVDYAQIMAHNWRMSSSYLLRSSLPGIVEYLFSFDGIFRAGERLARVYDIGNVTDWEKARQLLTAAGASPYLISGKPLAPQIVFPSAMPPVAGQFSVNLPIYTGSAPSPRAVAAPSRAALARAPASERPAPTSRATLARSTASETTEQEVVTYETDQPAPRPDNSEAVSQAQREVASADRAVETARRQTSAAEEDLAARDRLYQKGIIARHDVDTSRDRLDDARSRLSRAEAALSAARQSQRTLQAQSSAPTPAVTRKVVRRVLVPRATLASRSDTASPEPPAAAAPASPPAPAVAPQPQPQRNDPSSRVVWPAPLTTATVSSSRGGTRRAGVPGAALTPLSPVANQLGQVNWADQSAPSDGVLVRALSPNGALVRAGDPLLEVATTEWVRVYADITPDEVPRFRPGTPVAVSFDEYPQARFAGWISEVTPQRNAAGGRAELVLFCEQGLWSDDARYTIEWLALASPLEDPERRDRPAPLEPAAAAQKREAALYAMFPFAPSSVIEEMAHPISTGDSSTYCGSLKLADMPRPATPASVNRDASAAQKRLAALRIWREAFNRGMTSTSLAPGVTLAYPRDGEANVGIERMLRGEVSHIPDRCAGSMREALGWGLGDAHVWAYDLPRVGYAARPAGLARPGDILVWPFTYGPRSSQHIGFAVQQNGRLMLLSNLSGNLGTTEILPGFIAFYRPAMTASAAGLKAH